LPKVRGRQGKSPELTYHHNRAEDVQGCPEAR